MVARIYGRFAPRSDKRDRWERIAAQQGRGRAGAEIAAVGYRHAYQRAGRRRNDNEPTTRK